MFKKEILLVLIASSLAVVILLGASCNKRFDVKLTPTNINGTAYTIDITNDYEVGSK